MNNGNFYDYIYCARKKNKTDIAFSITTYISAAVFYFFSIFIEGIKFVPVLQFLALTSIVAGIYINQRYTWVKYIYAVSPSENKNSEEITGSYFIVRRIQGKRQTCLAKIDLDDCLALYDCTHKDDRKADVARHGASTRYNFRATMCPAYYCRAVFRADGGIAVIDFEPDETLAAIIRENIEKKQEF